MNICINIFGQIRFIERLKDTIEQCIVDNKNNFHILFTTWDDTDVSEMRSIFPDIYIRQYARPDLSSPEYSHLINTYRLDGTQRAGKDMSHYILGFYIKSKSRDTILNYEMEKNIQFDRIVTTRTYTRLFNSKIQDYYNTIEDGIVYAAEEPRFCIYSRKSYPDSFALSTRRTGLAILNVFDVLERCTIGDNIFHPETTAYSIVEEKGFAVKLLPFKAFVYE